MNQINPDFLRRSRTVFQANRPPSLAELREHIAQDDSLTGNLRRDLLSAFNRIEAWFGRPLGDIPATPDAVRELFDSKTAAMLDIQPRTYDNVRSLIRKCVDLHGPSRPLFARKVPPTKDWNDLLALVPVRHVRHGLGNLVGFCSAMGIPPEAVDKSTLVGLHEALVTEGSVKDPRKVLRTTVSAWNRCRRTVPSWPQTELRSPFKKPPMARKLEDFPTSFQADVAEWQRRVTDPDQFDDHAPDHPLSETTLETRLYGIRSFASALVDRDVLEMDEVTSLLVFFTPQRFKEGLRWFLERPHDSDSRRLHNLAQNLVRIARHYCVFDWDQLCMILKKDVPADQRTEEMRLRLLDELIQSLTAIAKMVEPKIPRQMTARNRAMLRQFDDPRNTAKLLRAPRQQMELARKEKNPLRAAKRIERALALALMRHGGLRQVGLRRMTITGDFSWTGHDYTGVCHLHVPASKERKAKRPIERVLPPAIAELLKLYLIEHRPHLPGADGPYLFPGETGGMRSRFAFGSGITKALREDAGLDLTPHQSRHAIAKIAVERDPGAAYAVSRVLGHTTIATTTSYYLGTEGNAAARHVDRLLDEAMQEGLAKPPLKSRRKRGKRV